MGRREAGKAKGKGQAMTTNKPTTIISYCTAALVFLLAAGAFVLSYGGESR